MSSPSISNKTNQNLTDAVSKNNSQENLSSSHSGRDYRKRTSDEIPSFGATAVLQDLQKKFSESQETQKKQAVCISQLEQINNGLNGNLQTANQNNKDLENKYNELNDKSNKLVTHYKQLNDKNAKNEELVKKLEGETSEIKVENAKLESVVKQAKSNYETLNEQKEKLIEQVKQANAQLTETNDNVRKLEVKNRHLLEENAKTNGMNQALEQKYVQLELDTHALHKSFAEQKELLGEVIKANGLMQQILIQHTEKMDAQTLQIKEQFKKTEEIQSVLDSFRKSLDKIKKLWSWIPHIIWIPSKDDIINSTQKVLNSVRIIFLPVYQYVCPPAKKLEQNRKLDPFS